MSSVTWIRHKKGNFGCPDSSHITRVVQVIHESVRQFFTAPSDSEDVPEIEKWRLEIIKGAHISIMNMYLDYLNVSELDALVEARHAVRFERGLADEANERNIREYIEDTTHQATK